MKKIGIDARLYAKTGVGVYIRNLIHYLQELNPQDIEFYIYLMQDEFRMVSFSSDRFIKRLAPYQWHSFAEQTSFLHTLHADSLDLMHFTYFSYPVRYTKKFIATVHDTILLDHKTGKASTRNPLLYELKHMLFRYVFSKQMHNAHLIITPCNSVADDLINHAGIHIKPKIHPIYEGVNFELMNTHPSDLSQQFQGNFFVYVGNFYPHKNIERLIDAFLSVDSSYKLVLAGPKDFFAERVAKKIQQLHAEDKIILYHNPSNADIVFFYTHAKALIHPSCAEGFGLPLVEAAYFKLPIIASNIAVYKELFDSEYLDFDPTQVQSIVNAMNHFIQKGGKKVSEERIATYSFKQMTATILDIYRASI